MDSQPEHHQTLLDRVRERVSRWSAAWDGVAPEDKRRAGICIGLSATTILLVGLGVFHFEERKYDRLVAERLREGAFDPVSRVWSAETRITTGAETAPGDIEDLLRRAGYAQTEKVAEASFIVDDQGFEWQPTGSDEPVRVTVNDEGQATVGAGKRGSYASIGPAMLTALPNLDRTKRRLVEIDQIPVNLREAVIAIEDHRFYDHGGVDWIRTVGGAIDGVRSGRLPRGVSTITQQLARGFFLTREKTFSRKLREMFVARALERSLTKDEILEAYLNQVYLGRSGAYNIAGVAEAAFLYFGKPLAELRVDEAAILAGMLQAPSALDPRRNPDRSKARRDTVLRAMARYGYLTPTELQEALARPVETIDADVDSESAPYFVDMVRDEAAAVLGAEELYGAGWEIRTGLDPQLQRAAMEAVRIGMQEVDERLAKRDRKAADGSVAQAAVVVLDPKTGAIKALVGGRDYAETQLNRTLAPRQPGSTFKPFVYAAAFETGLNSQGAPPITPVSLLYDTPTIFEFGDEEYEPQNYGGETSGLVTVREALIRSLNIPTVLLATEVGYDQVVRTARSAGLTNVQPTPSAALGSYEATLLELASAYTVFANEGKRVEPHFIESIAPPSGDPIYTRPEKAEQVMDPRVAHMVRSLMEDVVNRGTGAGIRARGFRHHAAGKTGTDDDGWFVGFTDQLLCAVWVGFDDNTELGLEGGKSALPIWAEFMTRAHRIDPYRKTGPFEAPEGVEVQTVNLAQLYPLSPGVDGVVKMSFIEGTRPTTPRIAPVPMAPVAPPPGREVDGVLAEPAPARIRTASVLRGVAGRVLVSGL